MTVQEIAERMGKASSPAARMMMTQFAAGLGEDNLRLLISHMIANSSGEQLAGAMSAVAEYHAACQGSGKLMGLVTTGEDA